MYACKAGAKSRSALRLADSRRGELARFVMPDASPNSFRSLDVLSALEQKRFQNACRAFEGGEWDYVLATCAVLLAAHPECLPVRRLQRAALLKKFPKCGALRRKLSGAVSGLLFSFWVARAKKSAPEQLAYAESRLGKNPYDTAALRLLGEAATRASASAATGAKARAATGVEARSASALAWAEMAVFAYEAIREIEPDNRANLLALGEALLAAERPAAALKIADTLLAENPVDGTAQTLMRKASIAQTVDKGNWEQAGDFRAKLKAEE